MRYVRSFQIDLKNTPISPCYYYNYCYCYYYYYYYYYRPAFLLACVQDEVRGPVVVEGPLREGPEAPGPDLSQRREA